MSNNEPRLIVFGNRSVLVGPDGIELTYLEGAIDKETQIRLECIRKALAEGYLEAKINESRVPTKLPTNIPDNQKELLNLLVSSITSEVGRALVGLSVLQMCIKSIIPEQSIRLHKGSSRAGESNFSWKTGIPMRVLDKYYITPLLRKHNLLLLNADGFMMTRSLAENYPYTQLYKAAIRGARTEWLAIVDLLEEGKVVPEDALLYILALLANRSDAFEKNAEETLVIVRSVAALFDDQRSVAEYILHYIDEAEYSARLFEIAMHSLYQVFDEKHHLAYSLKPLSQMRSANKKHGNIGDIELTSGEGTLNIVEAWDAKYGKPYLRDELEELNEKLANHPEAQFVGFVVDKLPNLKDEIEKRRLDIEQYHDVKVCITSFIDWSLQAIHSIGDDPIGIARDWFIIFAECLCQKRRGKAPIDEPSDVWVLQLKEFSLKLQSKLMSERNKK